MKGQIRVYYDEEADFFEIRIGESRENYGEELNNDAVLFKDEQTGEVVGFGIFNFKKKSNTLNEIGLNLPIDINLTSLKV